MDTFTHANEFMWLHVAHTSRPVTACLCSVSSQSISPHLVHCPIETRLLLVVHWLLRLQELRKSKRPNLIIRRSGLNQITERTLGSNSERQSNELNLAFPSSNAMDWSLLVNGNRTYVNGQTAAARRRPPRRQCIRHVRRCCEIVKSEQQRTSYATTDVFAHQ